MATRAPWRAQLLAATAAAAASSGQHRPQSECEYIAGKAGSNACPGGSVMATLSECHGAGAAGRGAGPVSVDSASEPSGCFVYEGAHYFNANAEGAPSEGSAPFCKRCPASTSGPPEAEAAAGAAGGNRSGEPGAAVQLEESFNTYSCSVDCPLWPGQLNGSRAEFRCFNGKCLNTSFYCDGRRDCPDGADEMHCSNKEGGAPAKEDRHVDVPVDVTYGKATAAPAGARETTTAPAEPYDCHADFEDWESGWTEARKEFCCKTYGGPCAAAAPPGQVQIYDCALDVETWQQSWEAEKKAWCCTSEHVGCEPYECGEDEDPAGMDAAQRAWCCRHLSMHCPEGEEGGPEEPHDCAIGVLTWRTSWDDEKQEWCCGHHKLGCGKRGEANLTLTAQQLAATSEPLAQTTTASRTSTTEASATPSSARITSSRSSTSTTSLTTSAAFSSTSLMGARTNISESSNTTRTSSTLSTSPTVTNASTGSTSISTTTSTRKSEQASSRPAQENATRGTTSASASRSSVATSPPSSTTQAAETSPNNSSATTRASGTASTTSTSTSAPTRSTNLSTTTSTRKAEDKSSRSAQENSTRSTASVTYSSSSVTDSTVTQTNTESTVTHTNTTASLTTTVSNTTASITSTTASLTSETISRTTISTSLTSETISRTTISTRTAVETTTRTRNTRLAPTTSSESGTPPTSTRDATGLGLDIGKAEAVSTAADTSTTRAAAPTAARSSTTTTLQTTSTQSASARPACSNKGNSAYLPLDLLHHPLKRVANERECQERCARVDGCAHYSYWRPARHCHLQGTRSRLFADALFSSGPPECPASPALVGMASVEAARGADSPLLRGSPPTVAGGAAAGALAALSLACAAGAALRGVHARTRAGPGSHERLLVGSEGVRSGRASPGAARWASEPSVDRAYGELPLVAPEEHRES